MKKISQRDTPIQPNNPELLARFWGSDDEIQVRDRAMGEMSGQEVGPDGKKSIIYDPWRFVGEIHLKDKTAYIDDCHVHPRHRNKGIASGFVDSFIDLCKKYGIKKITGISYARSVDFWRNRGFTLEPKVDNYGFVPHTTHYIKKDV